MCVCGFFFFRCQPTFSQRWSYCSHRGKSVSLVTVSGDLIDLWGGLKHLIGLLTQLQLTVTAVSGSSSLHQLKNHKDKDKESWLCGKLRLYTR